MRSSKIQPIKNSHIFSVKIDVPRLSCIILSGLKFARSCRPRIIELRDLQRSWVVAAFNMLNFVIHRHINYCELMDPRLLGIPRSRSRIIYPQHDDGSKDYPHLSVKELSRCRRQRSAHAAQDITDLLLLS